ncbi:MAG: hypothetical protein DRP46_05855 [Candidatus Zixiibacteriota bacterium]|nr:MAG: hypothetical protein DRP46_05855 [candidate division Zixibacteria bacterium]HDL03520.1 N-acetyltransferase [candidate division Zixibacteria bacterium]
MEKILKLKNGLEVTVREMREDDVQLSLEFFRNLPAEDREYLRVDVTDPLLVEQRIHGALSGGIVRLVALIDDKIVADGALEREGYGWKKHMAEIRLIVARPYQRKGLGLLLARELFWIANQEQIEDIMIEFMETQVGAVSIFKRLGFHEDAVLHDYVQDIHGNKHDLIIMRCNLKELWDKLDHYMAESDWMRTR